MTKPTISAIIPTFNRRHYVIRAVRSVLAQRPVPHEVLVIDDGSTDDTANLLRTTFHDAVRVVTQRNAGVSAARHRGILEATGEWIAFLDSDDEWVPDRTAKLVAAMSQIPSTVRWIFGDTRLVEDGTSGGLLFERYGLKLNQSPTVFDNAMETQYPFQFSLLQSSLIQRSLLLEAGSFDEGLRSSEDFLISFRAAMQAQFAAIQDVVTLLYRTSDLEGSSLDRAGRNSADHFRARQIAFGEAASRLGAKPWARLHEEAVRGLYLALARDHNPPRKLALEQFRYRVSLKALAFGGMTLLGNSTLRTWDRQRRKNLVD